MLKLIKKINNKIIVLLFYYINIKNLKLIFYLELAYLLYYKFF